MMARPIRWCLRLLPLSVVLATWAAPLGKHAGGQERAKPPAKRQPASPAGGPEGWVSYAPEQVGLRDALVAQEPRRNVSQANFGGITALQVRSKVDGKTGTSCRIFLWFDPTRLGVPGGQLEQVVLQLYNFGKAHPAYAVGEVSVLAYRVLRAWKEGQGKTVPHPAPHPDADDAISWSNQPTYNPVPWAQAALKPVPDDVKKGYFVNWDITGLTKAWLAGTYRNFGLVLLGGTEDEGQYVHVFASREYPDSAVVRPRIWVKVAKPPTDKEVRAKYDAYLSAYNRLNELITEGKAQTPEGQKAREEYERAKKAYEGLRKRQKAE